MKKQALLKACFALLLSAVLAVAVDVCTALAGAHLPMAAFLALFGLGFLLFALPRPFSLRLVRRLALSLLCLVLVLAAAAAGFLLGFSKQGAYAQVDEGKAALYAGQRVMVIAPHEDDEINIAGGVIEEYVRYGSRVFLVFVTNGDYLGKGETRMREALNVAARLGVPEDQVIFLGYGDGWFYDGEKSIYNAPADEEVISHGRRWVTYGLPEHPAFREDRSYTRRHLLEDMTEVLDSYRPDVILCSDYENHADHISTSLFMEEALCQILKADGDYHPLVLKSFCYNTAYFSVSDFYAENMLATRDPGDIPYCDWESRVRLPVNAQTLSRSMLSSSTYWQLRLHATQGASDWAERIISGDRVYWLRDTENLVLHSEISVSSGEPGVLNDFKLRDSADISAVGVAEDGVWIPVAADTEREVEIRLPEETALTRLTLYDNPSPADNVLDAELLFDDGSSLRTGALQPTGQANEIPLEGVRTGRVRIRLLQTEGARAGLTEIEADGEEQSRMPRYIKLMNERGDFVYDYYIDPSGQESFLLYAPDEADLDTAAYSLQWEGAGCSVRLEDGRLQVRCPRGRSCVLTLTTADGVCGDTVRISNPGAFMRSTGQKIEIVLRRWWDKSLPDSNAFVLLRDVYRLARYGSTASA